MTIRRIRARGALVGISLLLGLAACTQDIAEGLEPVGRGAGVGEVLNASSRGVPEAGGLTAVCGLSKSSLGKKVDQRPEKGRAQWALYDSAPGARVSRTFHITGFRDGCPRKVSGALAMFGSVELYEMVRFSGLAPASSAETDRAYASLRQGCSPSKPCAAGPLRRLSRNTAFLTVFPSKGTPRHTEILMHNGEVAAASLK